MLPGGSRNMLKSAGILERGMCWGEEESMAQERFNLLAVDAVCEQLLCTKPLTSPSMWIDNRLQDCKPEL